MEMGKTIVSGDETLTIQEYDPQKDEELVLSLWEAAFQNQIKASLWQWKYIDNPYDTTIILCKNTRGEPVVFYGGIPFASTCHGRSVKMIHLSDIMSHPDYRGSGVFIHTANAYFDTFGNRDDVAVMYGFPGKYHFDIGVKYLQYSHLGKGAAFLTGKVDMIKKMTPSPGTLTRAHEANEDFDNLWQTLKKVYPFTVVRDKAYLKWRFFNHPAKNYEIWCLENRGKNNYCGYMVLNLEGEKAIIVDMLLPDSKNLVADMAGSVALMMEKRGFTTMETWLPETHFLVTLLKSAGFEQNPEPIGIIPTIRLFDKELDLADSGRDFYYTMGDGDLF